MKRPLGLPLTQKRFVLAAVLIGLAGHAHVGVPGASSIRAHAPASAGAVTFEAASVKPNKSGSPEGNATVTPGRYTVTNLSLQVLIRFAYERSPRSRGLEPFEISGGPAWLATDRFDVSATAGREFSLTEVRSMLRALLSERFKLKTHYETRQGPVYRMVTTKRNTLGPQLRRAAADCAAATADPLRGTTPGQPEPCGYFGPSPTVPLGSGKAYQAFRGLTMEDLALRLYPYLSRRVIDSTGLTGHFDGEFEFTAEIVMPPPPPGLPNPYDGRVLPSVFSVLPQQLGLRLESSRGPVEMLIVDHAEHPTDD
jgi:uncharacterized protein (TIGR03435 family)